LGSSLRCDPQSQGCLCHSAGPRCLLQAMLGRDRDGFPARGLATFGEAMSSFNKGGNLASRRHGRTFLAQQTHLPTNASTIQDRTQNTNELDRDPLRCGAAPQPSRGSRTPSPWAPSRRPRSLPVTPRGYWASTSSTQRTVEPRVREWQPEASLSDAICGSGDLSRTVERRNNSCGAISAAELLPGGPGHRGESHSAASRGLNAFRWTDGGGGGYTSSTTTVPPRVPTEPRVVGGDLRTTSTPRAPGTDFFDRLDRNHDGLLTREEFAGGFGTEAAGLPPGGIGVSSTGLSSNASSRARSATGHIQLSNSPGMPSPRAAWGCGLASGAGTPKPLGDCPSPRSPLARSRAQLREPCAASLDCCTSISSGPRQPLLRTPQPMHLDGGGGSASCSTAVRASSATKCVSAAAATCASTSTTRDFSPPATGIEHSRAAIQPPWISGTADLLRGPGQQHGPQQRQQQQQQEPIVTTVSGGGDPRARSFVRLNGFLLRTHITSLVSALAEDGWLEAWEKEQLCHQAREGTQPWALAFLQVYMRFMEMDDVPMFVAGLRAQLA